MGPELARGVVANGGVVGVVVVGGGVAGGLLALELAHLGCTPWLVEGGEAATRLSYGLLPLSAVLPWLALERRHGPLGLRLRLASLQGGGGGLARLPLPVAQVEAPVFLEALARRLEAAGVRRLPGRLQGPPRRLAAGGWALEILPDPPTTAPFCLEAGQVVLAAGAASRALWPSLPAPLRSSWAGVLELEQPPAPAPPWPAGLVVPRRFRRPALEGRAGALRQDAWVVDAGLVPVGATWLAGQVTLVRPDPAAGHHPDPAAMEGWLRQGLAALGPGPATAAGQFRQVPVAFCTDGQPLAGPVAGARGLWVFTGFSGGFSQVPRLVPPLARAIAAASPQ